MSLVYALCVVLLFGLTLALEFGQKPVDGAGGWFLFGALGVSVWGLMPALGISVLILLVRLARWLF